MSEKVSQSEFAKRMGVSQPYIAKMIKAGKLQTDGNGKLEFKEAEAAYLASRAPGYDGNREWAKEQRAKGKAKKAPADDQEDLEDDADTSTPSSKPTMSDQEAEALNDLPKEMKGGNAAQIAAAFNKARAAEKTFMAKLKELELKEKTGELLKAEDVKREAQELAAVLINRLYAIPHKIAPMLVGLEDEMEIKNIIIHEIEFAIEELRAERKMDAN